MYDDLNLDEFRSLIGDLDTKPSVPEPEEPVPTPPEEPEQIPLMEVETPEEEPERVEHLTEPEAEPEEELPKKKKQKESRKAKKNRKVSIVYCIPFLLTLAVVTVSAWLIPLRPTVSESENRKLKTFPEFSLQTLSNGEYFSEIGEWFSDSFTFREYWMEAGDWLESYYGRSSIVVTGTAVVSDEIPVVAKETPAPEENVTEALSQQIPEESPEPAAVEETNAETETAEPEETEEPHSVARELEEIDIEKEYSANSNCAIMDGSVYPFTSFNKNYSDQYCQSMLKAAQLLEGKARVFTVLPLRSTSVMLSKSVREYMGISLDEDVLEYMFSQMEGGNVYCVDTLYALQNHNAEYLYFHSDHHWTALGAYYAYVSWCKTAGVEPVALSEYEEDQRSPYTGTFYWHNSKKTPVYEDTVYTYDPPGDIHLYIIDKGTKDSTNYRGYEQPVVTHMVSKDYYSSFLAGDHALCTFVNNDIEEESAILIVKDSYGNPFSYYYTQHYKYVYVMDYRQYFNRSLTSFVDYYNVDDVIFCTAMFLAQSDGGNSFLSSFIK